MPDATPRRRFRLDLRAVFRRAGREEAQKMAAQVLGAEPKVRPDGRPTGGSLAEKIRDRGVVRVARWGYVINLHKLGQVLLWYLRGTKRQRARPLRATVNPEALADAVAREAQSQFSAWDASEKVSGA